MARSLYCSVDPRAYCPEPTEPAWDLGYLGTYSQDRQPRLERLLLAPAAKWPTGRFIVAGPQYPENIRWPANVERIQHLAPTHHRQFYNRQRFTLNITRADMIAAGYSPSVRLFEAAACGTPIISDYWAGLEDVFAIGSEILVAYSADEVLEVLQRTPPALATEIGAAARKRVLSAHSAAHRAAELEHHFRDARQAAQSASVRRLSA
jgi:spore maturation protein CgeB